MSELIKRRGRPPLAPRPYAGNPEFEPEPESIDTRSPLDIAAENPPETKRVVFFSEVEKLSISGMYPEERYASGEIKKTDKALKFSGNMFATAIPDEIDFLRTKIADPYFTTKIVECKNMAEFNELLRVRNLKKMADQSSYTEQTITEKGTTERVKIVNQAMSA